MGDVSPEPKPKPKPTPASDRLRREAERDGPCEPGEYVLEDGRVVGGRELVRPVARAIRARRAPGA